ncbi:peptidylprolyl isomerase [Halomonas shantousis]
MQKIEIEQLPGRVSAPVIRVGETAIDEQTIASEMQYYPAETLAEAQLQAARALVIQELLRQRSVELGLASERDADAAAEEADLAGMLDSELEVPEPEEAACRRFFDANPERFQTPVILEVRHILLAAAPDDSQARDAQLRQGEELLEALQKAPYRFDEFAQRYSACPSREQGGQLGRLAPGQTVDELDRALRRLPEGLHDRPLASRYGWHLVSIDRRIEGEPLDYDQVADRVRHTLREQASRRALRHYLLALAERYGVEGIALDEESAGALMQ